MIKLTGIRAVEAQWQSLRAVHPIGDHESRLLMQAMGRLVDNYASQSEISARLYAPLQKVFDRLVQSYLEGYWIEEPASTSISLDFSSVRPSNRAHLRNPQALSPAMIAAAQRRSHQKIQPTAASEADTYIAYSSSTHRV